ncbi:MAG: Alanine racemase [Desulfotomaculum sp. 46_296]|nr:MAG: Alanine racemase [Desulfotomaculum sp. 46_296]HAU31058.1 alanine racemase [Desulfotomaculum sp.]
MLDVAVPVWAEIDLGAIAQNMQEIRKLASSSSEIMAVVKANAYGHGALETAKIVLSNGATSLAVARVEEAKELRKAGIDAPILLLGYTPGAQFHEVLDLNLIQTVYSLEMAEALSGVAGHSGRQAKVHIKVDTGMGRLGLSPGKPALEDILKTARLPHLILEGIFTHFATADSADKTFTLAQLGLFINFLEELRKAGLEFPLRHCANSAALLDLPQTYLNMVRPGIIIYGLYPSDEIRNSINLKPAMAFKTRIAQIKKVPAGYKISYGSTYQTSQPTIIAVISAGYADGYSRLLSSRGIVLVNGQRARVVGRVCMDQCMVDVGHINGVSPGDEVVLFGSDGAETIPVEEIAKLTGTISYEIICMVNSRVPRFYLS